MAAALAASAAVAMLGTGPAAYAAPAPQVSLPVAPIALGSDWSGQAGFGSTAPGFYVETSLVLPDVVHLQGAARQVSRAGSDPDLLGTLPPTARPDRFVCELVHTFSGTYADVSVSPSGQISLIGPRPPAVQDFSFVSLEGITYERSISATNFQVPVNTANYSGSTAFGTLRPEIGFDAEGTVYLSGAVARTSASGTGANTVGTVPVGFRPHRDVYLITHTFAGTYADLVITSAGQINLIDPRSPLATDLSFVSLEGLSYQP